jgi:KipI family sensor histidine kinase inhibitor
VSSGTAAGSATGAGSGAAAVGPFGDAAVLAEVGDLAAAHRLGHLAATSGDERLAAVDDLVVGMGTLTALFDARRVGTEAVMEAMGELARRAAPGGRGSEGEAGAPAAPIEGEARRPPMEVAVCFDGPDLEELAAEVSLDPAGVAELMASAELQVAFVGFAPGFAYLVGLPPVLAAVPRRPRPRPAVPAGSLAVGGGFAGIYPRPSPGGWHLVGRTDAVLFDPRRPPYAALAPGRRVRLRPVGQVGTAPAPARPPLRAEGGPALVVEEAGGCTLVEDLGRRAVAALGVPRAGAADAVALRLANRLLGNAEGEAALEVSVRGPRLRARGELLFAVVGDPARPGSPTVLVDGHPVPEGQVVPLSAGQLLELGPVGPAVRAVVALAGGVAVEPLLGSRSSDLLSGLGPGPLRPGDEIGVGRPGRPRGRLALALERAPVLRVLPGPDWRRDGGRALERIAATTWRAAPESNRIGTRLVADAEPGSSPTGAPGAPGAGEVPSRGMVAGAVQLPPSGELVVLGPDHPTVGGYPVPAVVASADLHRLAHLAPGDEVRFEVVDASQARAALARLESALSRAVGGWFPTRAG